MYRVAQKNVPLDKMQFLDNHWKLFYQNFRICGSRSFQQSLKILREYFHCFKNYSFFSILFHISKVRQRNVVTCNIQCSALLNSFFSKHILNVHPTFHASSVSFLKLNMALLIESCCSWLHIQFIHSVSINCIYINCKAFFGPSLFFGLG